VWGCFCFYPLFYPMGMWGILEASKADPGADIPLAAALSAAALFALGNALTRGANLQKFYWKTTANPKVA
jgi:hypothetical protein